MSKKKYETPETKHQQEKPIQVKNPKEKKSNSKRNWYWIIIILLVIVLATVVAFGIVHRQKNSNNNYMNDRAQGTSTTAPVTTELQMAEAGSGPLSKADFSFGGKTVKGYQNFIDLCEKEGGSHNYYFNEESDYCKNANRGVNIFSDVLVSHNSITDAFGEPDRIGNMDTMPEWNAEGSVTGVKYYYSFQYHGRTYYKIFYVGEAIQWAGVQGIEYIVE